MNQSDYQSSIRVEGIIFCAAHFVHSVSDSGARLHGHTYEVRAQVETLIALSGVILDYLALEQETEAAVSALGNRVLLPANGEQVSVLEHDGVVRVNYREKCWHFPSEDCVFTGLSNTTTENLCLYITEILLCGLRTRVPGMCDGELTVELWERPRRNAKSRVRF